MKIKYNLKKYIGYLRDPINLDEILYNIGLGLGFAAMIAIPATAVYDAIQDKDSPCNKRENEEIIKEKGLEKNIRDTTYKVTDKDFRNNT